MAWSRKKLFKMEESCISLKKVLGFVSLKNQTRDKKVESYIMLKAKVTFFWHAAKRDAQ